MIRAVTMVASMTSVSDPVGPDEDPTRVACAILEVEGGDIAGTLDAVRASVYEVAVIGLIGGEEHDGLPRFDTIDELMPSIGSDVDVVWLLHSDALPRPDALGALVAEMGRNDASLVGSKIVDAEGVHLESVGSATDVFGEPYSGLDPDEVDLEQYDVVRDVASVSGVSTLVRRDLLRGLGGLDPLMPPGAAGQDLSQRARLAGSRVMIVPSSEVRHAGRCEREVESWRERAGRHRSMFKVYSLVTLIWLIPAGILIGLIDGLARIFLREPRRIADHVLAVGWNIWRLPSSVAARSRVRAIRHVTDEELFRYQLPGSVLLRDLGASIGERLGWVIDAEPGMVTEAEIESEASRAVPAVVALTLLLLALAARNLLFSALPAQRYTLPPTTEWLAVLEGYAGSWNPAGLGSLEPVHPSVAGTALFQGLLGGWHLATGVITAAALALGTFGFGRLMLRLGVDGPSRYLAAIAVLAGPFMMAITQSGDWAGVVAIGAIPWFVDLSIAKWPVTWKGRIGRLGAIIVVAAVLASYAPVALIFGAIGVVAVSIFTSGVGTSSLLTMILAVDLGAFMISPYLMGVGTGAFVDSGATARSTIGVVSAIALAIAAGLTALAGRRTSVRAAGIGVTMVAVSMFPALFGLGGDVSIGAAVIGSLGAGMIVAAALAIDLNRSIAESVAQWIGLGAAVVVIAVSLTSIGSGRLGLASDQWDDRLTFVSGLSDDPEGVRTLVIGLPGSLPGDSRTADGYAYRLITGDEATSDQSRLAPPRIGDRALAEVLGRIDRGDILEPGELLAPFAIQWVMVVDDLEFSDLLAAQIDLSEVPLSRGVRVFRNDSFAPRAVAGNGAVWDSGYSTATGPSASTDVRFADNASTRFGPDWSQDGWANVVSGADGAVTYEPEPTRRALGVGVVGVLVVGALAALFARDRRAT